MEIQWSKGERCSDCGASGKNQEGSSCEHCDGTGRINRTKISTNEVAKILLPDEDKVVHTEESLNEIRKIFELARNKQKEN